MSLPNDFIFSQSALQDYLECPRRFELRYLLNLRWPALEAEPALAHEAKIFRGQEFHHLLHQHAAGVPEQTLEATIDDAEVLGWWKRYLDWQNLQLPARRFPELTLTAPLAGSMLMAKYDVFARTADGNFLIVDWKTGRPQKNAVLARRMQTIVYPYVLARAGAWLNDGAPIASEKIRMVYWFAETGETQEFQLTAEKDREDEETLRELISEIAARFEFPLTLTERACRFCSYRSLCERGVEAGDFRELETDEDQLTPLSLDLDEVEEIAF